MATCGKAEREESRRIFTGPVVVAATLDNFFSVRAAIFLVLLISVVERTVFSVVKFTCGHSSVFFFFLVPRPFGWTCWTLWQQAVRHRMQMVGLYPSNLSDLFYFLCNARATSNERQCGSFLFLALHFPFLSWMILTIQFNRATGNRQLVPLPSPFVNVWCNITSVRTPDSSLSLSCIYFPFPFCQTTRVCYIARKKNKSFRHSRPRPIHYVEYT